MFDLNDYNLLFKSGLVSILLQTYNSESYIRRVLDSLVCQSYEEIEIIIVDDGSSDLTTNIINKEYIVPHRFNLKLIIIGHSGQAAALSEGLRYVSGEFIFCIDSDDSIDDQFIANMVKQARSTNNEFFYPSYRVIRQETGDIIGRKGQHLFDNEKSYFEDTLIARGIIYPGHFFRSASLYQVTKGFKIYTGPGGQNAQLILPMSWNFGEPGFCEKSVYTIYDRIDSHSRAQVVPKDIINKNNNYRNIMIETLNRIGMIEVSKWNDQVNANIAKLNYNECYGTADKDIIIRCFDEYSRYYKPNLTDRLRYLYHRIKLTKGKR